MTRTRDIPTVEVVRPTRVEVDLAAIVANARALADDAGVDVLAVVKADAYGHGAVEVASALASAKVPHTLAVSLVEEGVELRDAGIELPILVMGPSLRGGSEAVARHELTPMVSSIDDLRELAAACRSDDAVDVHLKLDTGMGRLGLSEPELDRALEIIESSPSLTLAGLATHYARADVDDPDDPGSMTRMQLDRFLRWTARPELRGVRRHTANSAAALRFPETRCDAIRPGLALYGTGAAHGDDRFRSTTRLLSEVTQLRELPVGATVGYEALWTAARASRVAVVPIGYADGLPRSLTGVAEALVGGRRVPVVGVISMDITIVDVTDIKDVSVGAEVVFLGRQGAAEISIHEFAQRAGLSQYEVTCGISKRVPRLYR